MELFGIGPLELLTILVLALIVLGPKDMVKTGQQLGKFLRDLIRSPAWKSMMNTSREIRDLPTRLVRESGMQEEIAEINQMRSDLNLSNLTGTLLQESGIPETQEEINRLKKEVDASLVLPDPADPPQEQQKEEQTANE